MKKKIIKNIIIIFCAFLLIIVIAIISYMQFQKYSVKYNGTFYSSVDKQLIIKRNKIGIPEIIASNKSDVYFALGYVHAQDRKTSLIKFRKLVNLDLDLIIKEKKEQDIFSEIIGLLDINNTSAELFSSLSEENQNYLKKYSEGINAYFNSDKSISKENQLWSIDDSLKIFLLWEFAHSFLKNNELIFPFDKDNFYKMREIIPDEYLSKYSIEEKDIVLRLLDYRKVINKYIGNVGKGFLFFKYDTSSDDTFYGISLEGKTKNYPIAYPVVINLNNKNINAVTLSGIPFIIYGKSGENVFSIQDAMIDNMIFLKRNVIIEDEKYYYKSGYEKHEINEIQITENFYKRVCDDGIIISDYNKVIKNDFIVIMKYNRITKELIDCYLNFPFENDFLINELNEHDLKKIIIQNYNKVTVKSFGKNVTKINDSNVFHDGNFYEDYINDENVYDLDANNSLYISGYVGDTQEFKSAEKYWGNPLRYIEIEKKFASDKNISEILLDTESEYYKQYYDKVKSYLNKIPLTSAKLSTFYLSDWDYRFEKNRISPSVLEYINELLFYYTFYDEVDDYEMEMLLENNFLITDKYLKILETGLSDNFDDKNTDDKYEDLAAIFDKTFITAMRVMHRNYGAKISEWQYENVAKISYNVFPVADKVYKVDDVFSIGEKFTVFSTNYFYNFEKEKISVKDTTNFLLYGNKKDFKVLLNYSISNEYLSKYRLKNNFVFSDIDEYDEKYDELIIVPE